MTDQPAEAMRTTVEQIGDLSWRITVSGEVDAATSDQLSDVIAPLAAEPNSSVVVNLSEVSFMDSSGLRALIRGANEARDSGGSLVLATVSPPVMRLLEITGLVDQLPPSPN